MNEKQRNMILLYWSEELDQSSRDRCEVLLSKSSDARRYLAELKMMQTLATDIDESKAPSSILENAIRNSDDSQKISIVERDVKTEGKQKTHWMMAVSIAIAILVSVGTVLSIIHSRSNDEQIANQKDENELEKDKKKNDESPRDANKAPNIDTNDEKNSSLPDAPEIAKSNDPTLKNPKSGNDHRNENKFIEPEKNRETNNSLAKNSPPNENNAENENTDSNSAIQSNLDRQIASRLFKEPQNSSSYRNLLRIRSARSRLRILQERSSL